MKFEERTKNDLVGEIRRAKDWTELSDLLNDVTVDEIDSLVCVLPELAEHSSWVIRADAVDLIANFKIDDQLPIIMKLLEDKNKYVRSSALIALYKMCGETAFKKIQEFVDDRRLYVRLTAVCLVYAQTKDHDLIDEIEKIITRKNCDYHLQYLVFYLFDDLFGLNECPEIVELFKRLIDGMPDSFEISKDLKLYFDNQQIL